MSEFARNTSKLEVRTTTKSRPVRLLLFALLGAALLITVGCILEWPEECEPGPNAKCEPELSCVADPKDGSWGYCVVPFDSGWKPGSCRNDEFRCRTSWRCIPQNEVCNGGAECGDSSDEEFCGNCDTLQAVCRHPSPACVLKNDCSACDDVGTSGFFRCNRDGKSVCLDVTSECNGIADCDTGLDENPVGGCPGP